VHGRNNIISNWVTTEVKSCELLKPFLSPERSFSSFIPRFAFKVFACGILKHPRDSPCISSTYCPTTLELLEMVPRDEPEDDDPAPALNRILVVCCRSSTTIVSSGDVGRASGQMKL
jgi:hypothetical protein